MVLVFEGENPIFLLKNFFLNVANLDVGVGDVL